ncbi:putative membrane protein [Clostridium botulinum]|nr:putative membrane protein [Clostridium botulinum]OSA83048.1 hypothetical protein B2H84_04435 [Clostridium botulinum]
MNKYKDLFLCLSLFILGIFIWIYKTIITSDIPINISLNEFLKVFFIIFIYDLLQYIYIKKLKSHLYLLNLIFLTILLLIWLGNLITSLIYNYNKYDTLFNIISFISIVYIFFINIHFKIKNN